jgi:hypothetical protein
MVKYPPIMAWLFGGIALLLVGIAMRRLLGLSGPSRPRRVRLDAECEILCKTVMQELHAHSSILAVSLNDAIEERESGNSEIADHLLDLTLAEWKILADDLLSILDVISLTLPLACGTLHVRNIARSDFRSDAMTDYVRLHHWLDQFVVRTKLRYHLQIRVLRYAVETLTVDFREAQPSLQPAGGISGEEWKRLDLAYHDFDLVSKETVLALRNLVGCLPEDAIAEVAARLRPLLERGLRASSEAQLK